MEKFHISGYCFNKITWLFNLSVKDKKINTRKKDEEWCKRLSQRMSGKNNPNYGKPAWNSGKTSKDDDRILSGDFHPMHGKTHRIESRKKIS